MRVLGIMSGTSIDSVDYAICQVTPAGSISLKEYWQILFPRTLQNRLRAAATGQSHSHETAQLHHDLGRFYAQGVGASKKVDLIGLHGQIIFHHPAQPSPATFQIGEPAYLAARLNAPVISNFRAADLALGGQGAPLATMFHYRLFGRKGKHVAINNLGGISNVTSLDWRGDREPKITAFDTGPANMLVDLAVQRFTNGRKSFDRDGELASFGQPFMPLIEKWLTHPFFKLPPPKSTGREMFGEPFLNKAISTLGKRKLSKADILATLAEFTARSIALNYHFHLASFPDEVILAGGGARNPYLFARIAASLREYKTDVQIHSTSDYGWDPQTIEPAAFALLAWLTWNKKPGNIPPTTGAAKACLLGQLTPRPNS